MPRSRNHLILSFVQGWRNRDVEGNSADAQEWKQRTKRERTETKEAAVPSVFLVH